MVGFVSNSLPFPKPALDFTCLPHKSFENTVDKGEIARDEQFLLFPQCFSKCCSVYTRKNQGLFGKG